MKARYIFVLPHALSVACTQEIDAPSSVKLTTPTTPQSIERTARIDVAIVDSTPDGAHGGWSCVQDRLPEIVIESASCSPDCKTEIVARMVLVTTPSAGRKYVRIHYREERVDDDTAGDLDAVVDFVP